MKNNSFIKSKPNLKSTLTNISKQSSQPIKVKNDNEQCFKNQKDYFSFNRMTNKILEASQLIEVSEIEEEIPNEKISDKKDKFVIKIPVMTVNVVKPKYKHQKSLSVNSNNEESQRTIKYNFKPKLTTVKDYKK